MDDDLGAFCPHAPRGSLSLGGGEGPLAGLTVGIKDLFDIAGIVTGAGNPDWHAGAAPAAVTAPAVTRLVEAGGLVTGKTITDELAFSLNGENAHYGTPVNPKAPGRIPGGSSAGSAAAVAGGLVDIGLGTDTGGSVRLPASYCGIWGLRPTHGAVPIEGCVPLAPGFDTVGWFARDGATLARAGAVLLDTPLPEAHGFTHALIAIDAFDRLAPAFRGDLLDRARALASRIGPADDITLAEEGLDSWRAAFRVAQSAEIWQTHGDWVRRTGPRFGPGIAERFAYAASLGDAELAEARAVQTRVRARLDALLTPETLLVVPGASGPPPPCNTAGPVLEDLRNRALEVLCPAGLAGLPQLALPAMAVEEGPIGLGVVARRGADARLLALAAAIGDHP
jgi:amidase